MKYLFVILLPPLAILLCGKLGQAILNLPLCCFFWFPGVIHALAVCLNYDADQRMKQFQRGQ